MIIIKNLTLNSYPSQIKQGPMSDTNGKSQKQSLLAIVQSGLSCCRVKLLWARLLHCSLLYLPWAGTNLCQGENRWTGTDLQQRSMGISQRANHPPEPEAKDMLSGQTGLKLAPKDSQASRLDNMVVDRRQFKLPGLSMRRLVRDRRLVKFPRDTAVVGEGDLGRQKTSYQSRKPKTGRKQTGLPMGDQAGKKHWEVSHQCRRTIWQSDRFIYYE